MSPQGFIDRFLHFSEHHGKTSAIEEHESGRRFSYADARREIETLRAHLVAAGIKAGDPVLLMLPPGAEFIFAFYAIASLDAVAVTVSSHLTSWELATILDDARPVGAIINDASLTEHETLLRRQKTLRFVLCTDRGADHAGLPVRYISQTLIEPLAMTAFGERNPAISCHYTYKGLGVPIAILHRYQDYMHAVGGMENALGALRVGDVFIGWLPIYAVYSLTASVLLPLSNGCTILLVEKIRSNSLDLISQTHARVVPMVRDMFSLMLRHFENKPRPPLNPDLCITSGGSYLDAELTARAQKALGADVLQGYGTTETLPILGNFRSQNRHGSLGKLMVASDRVAVVDPHGRELPPGEHNIGEICVMGPTVTESFHNRPQDSAQFFRDGWFHTGDLGWRDQDGFFYFVGRRIAFTKMAAQMVDLVELEHLVESHPAISKARAMVKEDGRNSGEYLVVSVMLAKGMEADNRLLRDYCRKFLSPHKVPKRFNIYAG